LQLIDFVALMKIQKQLKSEKKNLLLYHATSCDVNCIMKYTTRTTLFILLFTALAVYAQDNIQITLGPDEIGENQAWTITVTVNNDRLKSYENFPDIEGFRKRGTSTSVANQHCEWPNKFITKYYHELSTHQTRRVHNSFFQNAGERANHFRYRKKGKSRAGCSTTRSVPESCLIATLLMISLVGETEFIDIKEDALLALTTSKDEVYVGEGFTTTLSFLVADNNRAPMQFHDLGKQLADILKKLRPANCWEENFNIENIEGEHVEIQGKGYTQYKVYQGTFYPLNTQSVQFPSVGLEMIKFKVAKNPSFFGQNRQEDFKTFYTRPISVKVKDLPPHPLRNSVAVGDYQLQEQLSAKSAKTGQSIGYDFRIVGEGNITAIEKPTVRNDANFDFYEPNMKQSIRREGGHVAGNKTYSYFMIPKEPGEFKLGDYFQWVFFNIKTKKYDTLRSNFTVRVEGESQKNQFIESTDPGSFYDRLDAADNQLQLANSFDWMKTGLNIFMLLMLAGSAYLIIKK
jgi:hypothetical protein